MPGGASQPRKQLDAWQEWAKQRGARGLAYVLVQEDGTLTGPVARRCSRARSWVASLMRATPAEVRMVVTEPGNATTCRDHNGADAGTGGTPQRLLRRSIATFHGLPASTL